MQDNKKVPFVLSWLDREGLQFMQTLNDEDQEKCKTSMGLFKVLSEKIKPKHNKTIISLLYCQILRALSKILKYG